MKIHDIGVYRLRDAIVRQAVEDYKKHWIRGSREMTEYFEGFFRSKYFSVLTEGSVADVEAMIMAIRTQAEEAEKERLRKKKERALRKEMMGSGTTRVFKGNGGASAGFKEETYETGAAS